ncbi:MAG TPA: sugar-binding protein, partial [Bacteroidales bacterium]|nr:sugar-binding protein [Bacteroidales bacterium]
MKNTIYIQLFLTLISINAFSQSLSADTDILKPVKTESAIIIDGKLNEPVWQKTFFTKVLYDENGRYNNTKAYFTYDADNLYAAFRCQINDTSKLSKEHLDKDNEFMLSNDWVAFCIDTYHDGITAYAFLADAAGNELDGALNTPSRDLSFSFSSKWTAAAKTNLDGYTVEMKIPLKNLPVRWNKDSVTMAIQIIRNDKQNNRMVQWPPTKNIGKYQTIVLHKINQTHPQNLSG